MTSFVLGGSKCLGSEQEDRGYLCCFIAHTDQKLLLVTQVEDSVSVLVLMQMSIQEGFPQVVCGCVHMCPLHV